ncbi:hypothetical protein HMPREF1547_01543 [Blautia sp. KLE 1732]|nr:hypothetical protein HMPREF1547_01543 [Blautia sp. KLE 1732]
MRKKDYILIAVRHLLGRRLLKYDRNISKAYICIYFTVCSGELIR